MFKLKSIAALTATSLTAFVLGSFTLANAYPLDADNSGIKRLVGSNPEQGHRALRNCRRALC